MRDPPPSVEADLGLLTDPEQKDQKPLRFAPSPTLTLPQLS